MTQRVVNYTYGTGNPVLPDGSIDVRDGIDNLQSMDVFMNAPEDTYNQRDGGIVRTVAGMNNEFDAHILNMGFTRIGTFATGATITNPRQTLLWDVADGGDGQEYGWSGAFPKVVPAASTPASTGGISVGAWISRFDPELRIQVREALRRSYAEAGYNLADGSFEAGGALVSDNDVLLHEASGKAFSGPAGPVAAGTDPASGGFVDRSNELLRQVTKKSFNTLSGALAAQLAIGDRASVAWRNSFFYNGGAEYSVVAAGSGTDDGGSYITTNNGLMLKLLVPTSGDVHLEQFGGVGDNAQDNSPALLKLLTFTIPNKLTARIGHGQFVFGSQINIDTLPAGEMRLCGIESTSDRGTRPSTLVGAAGLARMFYQAFDASLTTLRRLVIKDFSVISKDPWDNDTIRAPLRAFDLYNCADSTFENLDFLGITSGLHLRSCWLSKLKNIFAARVDQGVFIDGDDGAGAYGFADHVTLDNLAVGGLARVNGWGLRMRGSKSSSCRMLDMEGGGASSGLIVEGCKGIRFTGVYTESYQTAQPIIIKPIQGSSLKNLDDYSIGITIEDLHSLATGSVSGTLGVIAVLRGCKYIKIDVARHFMLDRAGREVEAGPLLSLSGISSAPYSLLATGPIEISRCGMSDREAPVEITSPFTQLFRRNGKVVISSADENYYGLTLEIGDTKLNSVSGTVQHVKTAGTMAPALTGITANTVAGSRKIVVNDATNIWPGTYITIGSVARQFVTSVQGNDVWLGAEMVATVTGHSVTYTAPTFYA